ncbi:MAG TPA: HAMP domain-containing sensor histidine kinase [Cyclobacteriaceae bacterium]|nr:HAMP domain-containing sensor histidine kinase [Cyclobacteriaceae bacterium]
MFRDRYSISIFIRVIMLVLICLLFAFLFARTEYIFSQVIVFTLVVISTLELIRYTRKSSRELSRFLFAVRHGDVSMNFSHKDLPAEFHDLTDAFRELIYAIRDVKIDKEVHYRLLQGIIDRIGIGIIASRPGGDILLMNKSAAETLSVQIVNHWNHIKKRVPQFSKEIESLSEEGRKLVELENRHESVQLSISVNTIKVREEKCRVVTFHDIRDEIEQKEIEAWYKLIRILTHEIMNSVTPLASLTETMLMLTEDEQGNQKPVGTITDPVITDIRSSVKTIQSRTAGILQFVEAYRKLTNIPAAEFAFEKLEGLIIHVFELMKPELQKRGIKTELLINAESQHIRADRNLVEQVLINLISNSIYALEEILHPAIKITSETVGSRIHLSIIDNGRGIDPSKTDKIFIPFYSTREGGSGIGLSFSKQVMYLHDGRIRVNSEPGKGAVFTLDFPKPKL